MKENRIEKTKIEVTYEYEAIDGTIFKDKDECLKYEESAKMVVHSKYQPLVIVRKSEYEIYDTGSEEYEIDIIKLKEVEDIELVLHLYKLYNPHKDLKDITETRNKLHDWYSTDETILIGRGCEYNNYANFYFIGTVNNIVEHIIRACNEKES